MKNFSITGVLCMFLSFFVFPGKSETLDSHLSSFWDELEEVQERQNARELDAFAAQRSGVYQFGRQQQTVRDFPLFPHNYVFPNRNAIRLPQLQDTGAYTNEDLSAAISRFLAEGEIDNLLPDRTIQGYSWPVPVTCSDPDGCDAITDSDDLFHILNVNGRALYQQGLAHARLTQHQNHLSEYLSLKETVGGIFNQYEAARRLLCVELSFEIPLSGQSSAANGLEQAFQICESENNFAYLLAEARDGEGPVWLQDTARRFPYEMNIAWAVFGPHWQDLKGVDDDDNILFHTDREFGLPEWLMTITGTVIIRRQAGEPKVISIPGLGITDNAIDQLVFGQRSAQYRLKCRDADTDNQCLTPRVIITGNLATAENSLFSFINEELENLVSTTATANQNFVNRTYLPVYRIMEAINTLPVNNHVREREKLAEIIAIDIALDYLENMLKLVHARTQTDILAELQLVQNWVSQVEQYLEQIHQQREQNYHRIMSGFSYLEHFQKREENPLLFSGTRHNAVTEILSLSSRPVAVGN